MFYKYMLKPLLADYDLLDETYASMDVVQELNAMLGSPHPYNDLQVKALMGEIETLDERLKNEEHHEQAPKNAYREFKERAAHVEELAREGAELKAAEEAAKEKWERWHDRNGSILIAADRSSWYTYNEVLQMHRQNRGASAPAHRYTYDQLGLRRIRKRFAFGSTIRNSLEDLSKTTSKDALTQANVGTSQGDGISVEGDGVGDMEKARILTVPGTSPINDSKGSSTRVPILSTQDKIAATPLSQESSASRTGSTKRTAIQADLIDSEEPNVDQPPPFKETKVEGRPANTSHPSTTAVETAKTNGATMKPNPYVINLPTLKELEPRETSGISAAPRASWGDQSHRFFNLPKGRSGMLANKIALAHSNYREPIRSMPTFSPSPFAALGHPSSAQPISSAPSDSIFAVKLDGSSREVAEPSFGFPAQIDRSRSLNAKAPKLESSSSYTVEVSKEENEAQG